MSTLPVAASEPSPLRNRSMPDRRRRPTSPWAAFRPGGRRVRNRRAEEQGQPYYVDRFSRREGFLAILLLSLSMVDATATLFLLGVGCEELNPAMDFLIGYGPQAFLIGKLALTAAGLPVLLICQNHCLFGTRFRVAYLLPILIGMYATLNLYQLALFMMV